MLGTGNSFEPDQIDNPKVRSGLIYRVLGGIVVSGPPRR